MDEQITKMQRDLGRLEGKVDRIGDAVSAIARNEARVDKLERDVVQHDKRIVAIERECSARGVRLKEVEDHAEHDTPIERWVGDKAIQVLVHVITFFAGVVLTKIAGKLF